MDFLVQIITAPHNWLLQILTNSGTYVIFILAIGMVLAFRFIIMPLTSSKSSNFKQEKISYRERTGKNK